MSRKGKKQKREKKQKKQRDQKKQKIISMKAKLLGTMLPVVIVMVILLVGIAYFISKSMLTEYSENLLASSIENQASKIEAWLNENLSAFQIVKRTIEGTHPAEEELQGILNQYYGYSSNYPEGLYIADAQGRLITAEDSSKADANPAESVWYKEGLTRINMGFTNSYTNSNGDAVISASGILNDGSDDIKVISADMTIERISIIVNSYIEMDDAQAFLVNTADGTILAHRDSSLISTKLSGAGDAFLNGVGEKIDAGDYSAVQIENNMTAFSSISGTNWVLVSYVPVSSIYADVNHIRSIMVIIGLLSVLLLALLIERVVHFVIRPVKSLTNVISSMTDGDFTVEVNFKQRDEVGRMSRSVEKFTASMREMISSIRGVSEQLHTQASNSNDVSDQMYNASQTQSKSMKELSYTVEQLSLSVGEIAENATTLAMVVADTKADGDKVENKVEETVDVSRKGKADLQNVENAMKAISESVVKLQQAIDNVGRSSEEITNITSLIGNIADQTNLLSLNASIEAARAGDAGKGFAVVATEIGQLAKTSADSVHNIDGLIHEVNTLVKEAVSQADVSVENINSSSRMVENALNTFDIIFDNIDAVNVLVRQMIEKVERVDEVASNAAAISEQQAASSEEILATAENMVIQADHITGNSEAVANEAKQLTLSAEQLAEQMDMFKIEKGGNES